jgi:signal transduction histidine kinase/response regulator RpfG family c-di-GMP phosphodiesterase
MNQPAHHTDSPPIKILVVDDHPNTATTLARAISQLGSKVEVISATGGSEALKHVKDGAVDILITDMIMPEMTGLELIEKLHNHPSGRPTFSFLMTAYDVPGLKVTARRLRVKEVIAKPVHPERICQIITQAMEELNHARPVRKETSQQKAFNILIADDQPDNLTLLARYLSNEGYGFIKAMDGLETLEKVRSELPDLVLLDVNMPKKDGFAVLEEIRSDPATQHIPVIILTAARLDPTEIQSGLNMGADDYVTKPFDRRELLARIRTKLRVKEAEDVIRRRNRELNLLPEIGKELSARLNIEDLATVLLKRTVETLGAMLGHIVILNPNGTYQKTYHLDSSAAASQFTLPPELLEKIKDTRQGFIIDDTQKDSWWGSSIGDSTRSVIIVPMFGRYHLLGVLVLTNEQTSYFTLDHLLLLQVITSQASIAVENAQLYDKMAQEQQRLSAVLQSAADAILMFDREGRLSLVNPAGHKLFTDYEAKLGQRLTSSAGYDSFLRLLDQARLFNASFSGEVVWPDKRVFSASMTPVQEGGIVVVLHDITHFKQLEKVKNEFIATASHDLRNPITSIKGYSVLIQNAGSLNEHQVDFAKRIQHAAEHMTELVENMLDLAKMDLGAEQKQEMFDIASALYELTDEFQPQAEAKRQLLKLEHVEANSQVQGDALKLRQALRNLIGNAIKYTPEAGLISLSLTHESDMINIRIKDTGYGIPAADLPHIFTRFYRVRNNGHDEIEGNGLGLAIVKSIAEGHGGDVTVESESGKGSCFTLTLPLANEK